MFHKTQSVCIYNDKQSPRMYYNRKSHSVFSTDSSSLPVQTTAISQYALQQKVSQYVLKSLPICTQKTVIVFKYTQRQSPSMHYNRPFNSTTSTQQPSNVYNNSLSIRHATVSIVENFRAGLPAWPISLVHWFLAATDLTARLSVKVDRGLIMYCNVHYSSVYRGGQSPAMCHKSLQPCTTSLPVCTMYRLSA